MMEKGTEEHVNHRRWPSGGDHTARRPLRALADTGEEGLQGKAGGQEWGLGLVDCVELYLKMQWKGVKGF